MCPAERPGDSAGSASRLEQLVVPGIGDGLQDAAVVGEMITRVFAPPVARVMEHRRRRGRTAERSVVADIGPDAADIGPNLGEHGHRGIVAVEALDGKDMRFDQRMQRLERGGIRADLIGERRQAEIDAFMGIAVALPVERLVRDCQEFRVRAGG